MSPPGEGAGASAATAEAALPTISTATRGPDHAQGSGHDPHRHVLVAVGRYHAPAGRRHLGVVIVERCPGCGHLHLHRALTVATADGSARTGSCGIEYRLRLVPTSRSRGGALVKVLHPDVGGDTTLMVALNRARDRAVIR